MAEYFGYSRQHEIFKDANLVSDEIIEKTRKKVESIFGNARADFTIHIEKRGDKIQEGFLVYRTIVKSLTTKMVKALDSKNNFMFIADHGVHLTDNGKKLEIEIRIHRFWAEPRKKYSFEK